MKKIFTNKIVVIIIGLLTILVLALVTSGLEVLEFKQAVPFDIEHEPDVKTIAAGKWEFSLLEAIFISITLLFLLTILGLIFMSFKHRRWAVVVIAILLLGTLFLLLMPDQGLTILPPEDAEPEFGTLSEGTLTPMPTLVPAEFTSPPVASWVSYIIALVVLLGAAFVAWFLIIRLHKPPLLTLEEIAHTAVDDLQAGKDWGRTIEGVYLRMVDTVQKQRSVRRDMDITPAEFAVILERTGLPVSAVQRLTSLFERVRYGGKKSTRREIEEAVDCLTEIADACQEIHL